jgi:hypothetical protein
MLGYPYAPQAVSPRMNFNPQSVLSTPMSATSTWRTVGSEGAVSVRGGRRHSSSRQSPERSTSRSAGGSGGSGGSGGNIKRLYTTSKEDLKQIGTRGTPRGENADSTIAAVSI